MQESLCIRSRKYGKFFFHELPRSDLLFSWRQSVSGRSHYRCIGTVIPH